MFTLSMPYQRLTDALDLPAGVRAITWDFDRTETTKLPADLDLVVAPYFFHARTGFELLSRLPHLQVVQLPSAGYEHAVGLCPPQITLCNARGVHTEETAEMALGLILAQLRGIDQFARRMPAAQWDSSHLRRPSLVGRTALVVGYGSIGSAIANRLEPFGARVVAVARTARRENGRQVHAIGELERLLPSADIVVLSTPLTDDTLGLVDAEFLARMPDDALLVNVGRGKVVDTDALVAEVRTGRLRAALDVVDPEPLPSDHPLWRLPGVLLTPHQGGDTTVSDARMVELVQRQVAAVVTGHDLENVVHGPARAGLR